MISSLINSLGKITDNRISAYETVQTGLVLFVNNFNMMHVI
ncbi:MAG: hypothetical protein ABII18_08980 [bacterium]